MTGAVVLDRDRLVKLCGMFGSDHAGERANAAASADKLIREAGMRWPDVIFPALPRPRPTAPVPTEMSFAEAIRFVLEREWVLTPWERGFVRDLRRLKYPLSPRQLEVLERLVEKVRRAEARAA